MARFILAGLPEAENPWSGFVFDPEEWRVDSDGAIAARPGGGTVWTLREFDDFELELDFKLAPGTNSGVMIRVDDRKDYVQRGLEVQVLDSHGTEPKNLTHVCGAIYDMAGPESTMAVNPAGEWNSYRIVCDGPMVQIVLNGEEVLEVNLDEWTEVGKNPDGTKNKFKIAGKDKPRSGFIGLQDHNDPVWFRDIRIKPLGTTFQAGDLPEIREVDGWQVLFDGTDTIQWVLDERAWIVEEDVLRFLGRPFPIVSKNRVQDFELEFEFFASEGEDGHVEFWKQDPSKRKADGFQFRFGDWEPNSHAHPNSVGSIRGCATPAETPKVLRGEWNTVSLRAENGRIRASINDQELIVMDLDQWTIAGRNPDGSRNRFRVPLNELPQEGHFAFSGYCPIRNVRIREILGAPDLLSSLRNNSGTLHSPGE